MNDLISRQHAIRWVKTECNPYGKPSLDYESGVKVINHLENMPSAQQWIPCSERLPEKPDTYIATLDYGKLGLGVGQRYYYDEDLGWNDDCVIAWMPLPEPYKEEK